MINKINIKIFNKINTLFIIIALLLCGCSASEVSEATPSPTPTLTDAPTEKAFPAPREGGSVRLSMRLPLTLNPMENEDVSVDEILKLCYEPLVVFDDTLKPLPNPALIETVNLSMDGLSAIVNLKNDIHWSNGSLITADDVIKSLDMLKNAKETAVYKDKFAKITEYKLLSSNSVSFTFSENINGLLYPLAFPVVPAGFEIDSLLQIRREADFPPVNGIYKFFSYTPSQEMVLVRNETSLRSRPLIDQVNVSFTKDHETDLMAFEQRLIDVVYCDLSKWSLTLNIPNSEAYAYISSYFDFAGFNFNKTLFQQKEVREAISLCLNKVEIMNNIYINRADYAYAPIPESSYLFNDEYNHLNFSVDEANALLYDSEFSDTDGDKVYEKYVKNINNEYEKLELKFTILYNQENEVRKKIALLLAENLNKIGFSVEAVSVDFEEFSKRIAEKDYDMFVGGMKLKTEKPDFSFMFSSESADLETTKNYFGYKNTFMDVILNKINSASSETEYTDRFMEFQEFIWRGKPILGIAFREEALFTVNSLYGCENVSLTGLFYNLNLWYL